MRWFVPSWNGDLRLDADDAKTTTLTMIKPTPDELMALGRLEHQLRSKKWWKEDGPLWTPVKDGRRKEAKRQQVTLHGPLKKIAPMLVKGFKPGKQTLTTLVYSDGKIETVDGTQGDEPLKEIAEKAADDKDAKAVTVKRATPCCPQCEPGSVEPANEVLQAFLSPEQHATWASDRRVIVRGGITGHRYVLAHRNSETAVKMGRMCMDLDDRIVMHFHDRSVPPEEEVLGAMMVLGHREPWLRNEATGFQRPVDLEGNPVDDRWGEQIFQNPFGDITDGIWDAHVTQAFGGFVAGLIGGGPGGAGLGDTLLNATFEETYTVLVRLLDEYLDHLDHEPARRQLVRPEDEEIYRGALKLARMSPESIAELLVYWKRKATDDLLAA